MSEVYLYIPKKNEIYYRQKWLQDAETMKYNAGYEMNITGYNYETGTITKSDEEMNQWYDKWVNVKDKYYAFIIDSITQEIVGEIYFYKAKEKDIYNVGILIFSKYRGKGYSCKALVELEKVAFEEYNVNVLSDEIPSQRIEAVKTFEKAGFIKMKISKVMHKFNKEEKIVQMILTKERYLQLKVNN